MAAGGFPQKAAALLRNYAVVVAVVALYLFLVSASDGFFSFNNTLNVLRQASIVAIVAFAMTYVFIAGGFDLSVGSVFALGGALAAGLSLQMPVPLAILIAVVAGGCVGVINGLLVTKIRINPFVTTLATLQIVRGLALNYTDAAPIRVATPEFMWLGGGRVYGIPVPVILLFVIMAVAWFVLVRTRYGRYVYASGSNASAARIAGVPVDWVVTSTYVISGAAAALAGVIFASRIGVGAADVGQGSELAVIAAVLVGGTSLLGGEGSIWRTAIGALFFALLANGFNLMNVPSFWQDVTSGMVILMMVGADAYSRRSKNRN